MKAATAVLLVALVCGCGGPAQLTADDQAPRSVACDPQAEAPAPPTGAADLSVKPTIEISDAPPPCMLVTTDIVVGDGPVAEPGATTTVKYVGVTYLDGREFDTSWGDEDFTFLLGGGEVIPGWDQGIAGMQVGGRRELVIPPELGYGPRGSGPIPPGATLVFVIDLIKVA